MKKKAENTLLVVVKNPPTKEQAKKIIKRISSELSNLYSQQLNVTEDE